MREIFTVFVLAVVLISGCSASATDTNKPSKSSSITEKTVKDNNKQSTASEKSQTSSIGNSSVTDESKQLLPATIVKNIDGDTVGINVNGKDETIRMLCVDTPETHHPRLGVQPFGPEAADFTKKTLYPGRKVEIELGIGGGRDKYGRLLAYIYVDGKMFNEMLLEQGLARVAYIYAPNTKYVDEFYTIQKEAQQKGIGIWSIENYAKDDGFHPNAVSGSSQSTSANSNSSSSSQSEVTIQNNPNDDQETNLNCKGKIKGNANSHIYHVPGGAYYDSVKDNIVWFCSEQDAINAGYHKSKR
jgi:micrococcal nuclease